MHRFARGSPQPFSSVVLAGAPWSLSSAMADAAPAISSSRGVWLWRSVPLRLHGINTQLAWRLVVDLGCNAGARLKVSPWGIRLRIVVARRSRMRTPSAQQRAATVHSRAIFPTFVWIVFPTTFLFWVSFSSSLRMPQQNSTRMDFPSGLCHRNGRL